METLVKLLIVGAILGGAYYAGNAHAAALVAVLLAPVVGVMFARDIMNFFGGLVYAMRRRA